jgi:hypothetical protein
VVLIIMMVVVMSIIGLTLIVIARSYGNGNLGFRFGRNQSEQLKEGQDQEKSSFIL